MKILLTGATGLIGQSLIQKLLDEGHEIHVLTRNKTKAQEILNFDRLTFFEWENYQELPPINAFEKINAIINLMGENIGGKRWSEKQKKELSDSRIIPTKNLIKVLNQEKIQLSVFINASAIGIYPANTQETLDENSKLDGHFLGQLCQDWEKATDELPNPTRKVILRTGVVLSQKGGALQKMLFPFQMGVGGIIGNGQHFMSWIHLDDLVNIYLKALVRENFNGPINACSPHPVTNYTFTKELGKALHRPTIFPVPAAVIKMLFGEMSSIILNSQKVIPKKLELLDFEFKYPHINEALKEIF